jgi:two-component system cell cycle sensor histidine kinase/response regulator CckA
MTDRDGRFLFGNNAFLRMILISGLPPFLDLVVRRDKAALSDCAGFVAGSGTVMAVRLATQPDEPVSLGLAGVRGLGGGCRAAQP